MENLRGAANWRPQSEPRSMRWRATIGMLCVCLWLSLSGCQPSRSVVAVDCDKAERELRRYTAAYIDALETIGVLRQQIKAVNERR